MLIKNVLESATQQLLLQKGDIDVARNDKRSVEGSAATKAVKTVAAPEGSPLHGPQLLKNQYLGNKDARQAMKYLVDYDGLQRPCSAAPASSTRPSCRTASWAPTTDAVHLRPEEGQGCWPRPGLPDSFNVTMDVTNSSEFRELSPHSLQNSMAKGQRQP